MHTSLLSIILWGVFYPFPLHHVFLTVPLYHLYNSLFTHHEHTTYTLAERREGRTVNIFKAHLSSAYRSCMYLKTTERHIYLSKRFQFVKGDNKSSIHTKLVMEFHMALCWDRYLISILSTTSISVITLMIRTCIIYKARRNESGRQTSGLS